MAQTAGHAAARRVEARHRRGGDTAPVGASYGFDPMADGIAGIYAARVLMRGVDPRLLCADIRADRLGDLDREPRRRALKSRQRATHFGRGTAQGLQVRSAAGASGASSTVRIQAPRPGTAHAIGAARTPRRPRQLAIAGIFALLLFPLGFLLANAQETANHSRYIVEPDDTLEAVAAEFGVDPAAILSASALQNPPSLTAGEVIVIPDPSESPDAAASTAAQWQGSSPFVVGAHEVVPGETLAGIARENGLDPWALANFNRLADIDSIASGQRLRIPLTDSVVLPDAETVVEASSAGESAAEVASPGADTWEEDVWEVAPVGAAEPVWEAPASGPVFAADVPAYLQAYSLSCEYAAAYIATAGFGWGVPESAFVERIGGSLNPHWGYRGDIHGAWGGSDDYGVYPEALVPTLNEFGFVGDVFYGGDGASLTSRIDAGMPVLAWLGYFGDTAWRQDDEGSYLLAPGMHVVTVYGYDDWGVYVSNPGRGIYDYYAWGDFLSMWNVLDGMGLGIAPM